MGSPSRVLAAVGLMPLGMGINLTVFTVFLAFYYREQLALTAAEVSVLLSVAFLVYAAAQFMVSLFLDVGVRVAGRGWMLVRVPLLFGVGWAIMALSASPVALVVCALLVGLGGAWQPLVLAVASEQTPTERSGLVASAMDALQLAGQLLALGAGWLLVGLGRIDLVVMGNAAMWTALTGVLLLALRDELRLSPTLSRVSVAPLSRLAESARELRRMFIEPETRAIKTVAGVAAVVPLLAAFYVPLQIIALVGDPAASASYVAASTAAGYAAAVLLTPVLGAVSDRWGSQTQLLLGVLLLTGLALGAISWTRDPSILGALWALTLVLFRWLTTLHNAVLLTLAARTRGTTFFLANQLPFFAAFPLGLLLGTSVVGLTGAVANAIAVVAVSCIAAAVVWARHLNGSTRARRATLT